MGTPAVWRKPAQNEKEGRIENDSKPPLAFAVARELMPAANEQ
jgi:hypothetical protein